MERDPVPASLDCMAIVRGTPIMQWSQDGRMFVAPPPENLPSWIQHVSDDGAVGSDSLSLFGVLWGSCNELYNQMQPLQTTANALPQIVAHSDQVHTELADGLAAIRTAVGAVQTAATSLGSALPPITQTAAQAQAQAAIANAAAAAAAQRCAALEARVATLEARKVQTWRAAGNLPTLAVNASTPVSCPWTSAVPSPLPNVDQCQAFVATGSAIPTVSAVSTNGVTVNLKALAALLPAAGAVQVQATTFS